MHNLKIWILISSLLAGSVACQGDVDEPGDRTGAVEKAPPLIEQIPPPLDLKEPPPDAAKTASGLLYKKLSANTTAVQANATGTVLVHYTGWRRNSGDTFFTTRGRGRPIAIDLAQAVPGFAEAMQALRKGEKAVLWMPAGAGATDALVYEVEVVDVVAKPAKATATARG
jgi:hypothetical protein